MAVLEEGKEYFGEELNKLGYIKCEKEEILHAMQEFLDFEIPALDSEGTIHVLNRRGNDWFTYGGLFENSYHWLTLEIYKIVIEHMKEHRTIELKNLTLETTFEELGIDALHATEIFLLCGRDIGIDINDDYTEWKSLKDIFNSYKIILEED